MNGQDILTATRGTYLKCTSYRDAGDTVSVIIHDGPQPRRRTTSHPFSTWFLRPNRFRFEVAARTIGASIEWLRYVVWEREDATRAWCSLNGEQEAGDVSRHLAGTVGFSGMPAERVPCLLMPARFEQGGAPGVVAEGIESVGDVLCHKLSLAWPAVDIGIVRPATWWVGTQDFLIRREFNVLELGGERGKTNACAGNAIAA